ncbi:hypothetical protein HZH68_009327 [Vespula germanica]|uniref:Large ribosomal subunit protein mL53 n=1 Tax=Vespula germanica TaxID=30212 RepID=A0A834JX36_VESGE|nr:hypothetical protein HZH68_009327 [Vespula germanica]
MSIPFSGSRSRSGGLISAIAKQLKEINLKLVNKIIVQFDPFHKNITETRKFLFYISSPKILNTNPFCALKTRVVCDRSEPVVTFDLLSGNKIIFKCGNLSTLDILQYCNKHVSSLVPPPEKSPKELLLEKKEKKKKKKKLRQKPFSKKRHVIL